MNNENICPLCQQSNSCDVSAKSGCWCMTMPIPQALFDKIPIHLQGISCICSLCILRYTQQEKLSTDVK